MKSSMIPVENGSCFCKSHIWAIEVCQKEKQALVYQQDQSAIRYPQSHQRNGWDCPGFSAERLKSWLLCWGAKSFFLRSTGPEGVAPRGISVPWGSWRLRSVQRTHVWGRWARVSSQAVNFVPVFILGGHGGEGNRKYFT